MAAPDYLRDIRNARDLYKLATYIRAFGCRIMSGTGACCTPDDRCRCLESYVANPKGFRRDC